MARFKGFSLQLTWVIWYFFLSKAALRFEQTQCFYMVPGVGIGVYLQTTPALSPRLQLCFPHPP